ncbi:MAG: ATP-dependent DNA helicase RecG [Burkholderiaceae bacterium]|nr:ATP-dependent DNA helicase RecG [Burkholderiaceae bacterium]
MTARAAGANEPTRATAGRQPDVSRFARLGIRREQDLLLHLPIRYEDLTRVTPIGDARPGAFAQFEGEVIRAEVAPRPRKMLNVELRDATGGIGLRFFHFYPSQQRLLSVGNRLRVSGEVRGGLFGLEIVHPRFRQAEAAPLPERLTPVYPSAAGIGQEALRRAVAAARRRLPVDEVLSPGRLGALGLPDIAAALEMLHEPPPGQSLDALQDHEHPAWRRVILDELIAQQVALRRARARRSSQRAEPLRERGLAQRLLASLPFELTGAQAAAWSRISTELARNEPMNCLLQGDVGSGKTVVAALAAAQCAASGRQAALMAPTEILAEQHARKLGPLLGAIGVRVEVLTGSMRESEKRRVRERLAASEVDLLIGTHALIEQAVSWSGLGLAIVDEQHRFGVAQRLKLRQGDGPTLPHQLMMSATPIPRTLAMTYYADLDVAVIDALPPGRKPVATRLVSDRRRAEVVGRVGDACDQGRQVYWVCPLIEESESAASGGEAAPARQTVAERDAAELQNAIDTHATLSEQLAPRSIGLVHGRLAPAEKQAVMDAFVAGEIQVLVATTVIEVGVDVANASLMVIEHAERFGLAQLHQLRGRVGRGAAESTCVLLYREPLSATAKERLKAMYETTDGFEIARRDLMLRGPGEFLGARQSGVPMLRYADLERDVDLVERARDLAAELLEHSPGRADLLLQRWFGGTEDFLRA